MVPTQCPFDETLIRYATGDLEDTLAESVDAHLSECEMCLARIEAVTHKDELFAELRRQQTPCTPALDRAVSRVLQTLGNKHTPLLDHIAGYTLLEEIGRGGMGQVFRARHAKLDIDVAIKLLRPGHDTEKLRARFETERQTLARMDHPNIAKVFDAGVTDQQRPYIVMEYVSGQTLARSIEQNDTDLATRLHHFRQICQGIQHAHQKGIIHRDIKPSNVLMTAHDGQLVPKIIDFGVARAVDPDVTRHTVDGLVVGTPEYLSPEQTRTSADAIDTRSDVHTLGVLLYELLTGDTPIAAVAPQDVPVLEVMRLIREVDPPPPSQHAKVKYPSNRVRDELDWITLKALEKDPVRRYQSAAELSEDVGRLLADETVLAAPASRRYRLKKFVRRNRVAVVGGSLVFLSLCAGIVGTTAMLFRAKDAEKREGERAAAAIQAEAREKQERQRATQAEADALADRKIAVEAEADSEAFNTFLVKYVLAASRPSNSQKSAGRSVTLVESLALAEKHLADAFQNRPAAEFKARMTLGQTWYQHTRYADAEKQYLLASQVVQDHLGADIEKTMKCQESLLQLYSRMSRYAEARKIGEELLPRVIAKHGTQHDMTLIVKMELGDVYQRLGLLEQGVAWAREAMEGRIALYGRSDDRALTAINNYAMGLSELSQHEESLRLHQEILDLRVRLLGEDHYNTIGSMNNVGKQLAVLKRYAEAAKILERALPLSQRIEGEEQSRTLSILSNLGYVYTSLNRLDRAIPILEQTLEVRSRILGEEHAETLMTMQNLASAYSRSQRVLDAISLAKTVHQARVRRFGPLHADTITAANNLGYYQFQANRFADGIATLEPIAQQLTQGKPASDIRTLNILLYLSKCCRNLDDSASAERWLQLAMPFAKSSTGLATPSGLEVIEDYGHILCCRGRFDEAEAVLRLSIVKISDEKPTTVSNAVARSDLGECLRRKKAFADSEQLLQAACQILRSSYLRRNKRVTWWDVYQAHQRLIELCVEWGKPEEAAQVRMLMAALRERAPTPRAIPKSTSE